MSNENIFENPEALEAELAATETVEKAPKQKKAAKPRIIKVKFVADQDIPAGTEVEFDYEVPRASKRGQVAGIPLVDMTEEQLKIEYRNANSVHYKTVKAGRDATRAEERLNACKAEMEKRGIQPGTRSAAAKIDASTIANLIKSGKVSIEELQELLDQDGEA